MATIRIYLAVSILFALLLTACPSRDRAAYQRGLHDLQAQQYSDAVQEFDQALAANPGSELALLGKARALVGLNKYAEALPLFEEFLAKTENQKTLYQDERFDAEFYRDKCKQELGQDVAQDPNEIPPPPMGE